MTGLKRDETGKIFCSGKLLDYYANNPFNKKTTFIDGKMEHGRNGIKRKD